MKKLGSKILVAPSDSNFLKPLDKESTTSGIESSNVYNSIEPLYITTLIMGLSPYKYRFIGEVGYHQSKLLVFYSFIILLIFIGVYIIYVHDRLVLAPETLSTRVEFIHINLNNVLCTLCILSSCWRQEEFIDLIRNLSTKIDRNFHQFKVKIQHRKTKASIGG